MPMQTSPHGARSVYMACWVVMQKTTVYLPDDLKRALQRAARETRRSEADLIRDGVRLVVAQGDAPAPRFGVFDSGDPFFSEHVDELLSGFGEL